MQTYSVTAQDQRGALERAVVISLFTWRRAETSDAVDDADRQGWWGDTYPAQLGDRIGSRLWLLRRRAITAQTLRDAERFVREALQWLIDDGHVLGVDLTLTRPDPTRVAAQVVLRRPDGDPLPLVFEDLLQVNHAL